MIFGCSKLIPKKTWLLNSFEKHLTTKMNLFLPQSSYSTRCQNQKYLEFLTDFCVQTVERNVSTVMCQSASAANPNVKSKLSARKHLKPTVILLYISWRTFGKKTLLHRTEEKINKQHCCSMCGWSTPCDPVTPWDKNQFIPRTKHPKTSWATFV